MSNFRGVPQEKQIVGGRSLPELWVGMTGYLSFDKILNRKHITRLRTPTSEVPFRVSDTGTSAIRLSTIWIGGGIRAFHANFTCQLWMNRFHPNQNINRKKTTAAKTDRPFINGAKSRERHSRYDCSLLKHARTICKHATKIPITRKHFQTEIAEKRLDILKFLVVQGPHWGRYLGMYPRSLPSFRTSKCRWNFEIGRGNRVPMASSEQLQGQSGFICPECPTHPQLESVEKLREHWEALHLPDKHNLSETEVWFMNIPFPNIIPRSKRSLCIH